MKSSLTQFWNRDPLKRMNMPYFKPNISPNLCCRDFFYVTISNDRQKLKIVALREDRLYLFMVDMIAFEFNYPAYAMVGTNYYLALSPKI